MPVERLHTLTVDGTSAVQFGFKLNEAPAPDRRYVADVYGITPMTGGFKLLFAQEKIGSAAMRSLLVVQMHTDAIRRFVESTADLPGPRPEFVSADPKLDLPTVITEEPEQTLAVSANVVAVALSNGESCMDFYQISPFASHAVHNGGELQMSQVVRIEWRTGQLFGFLAALERLGFQRRRTEVMP